MFKRMMMAIAIVLVLIMLVPCSAFAEGSFQISDDGKTLISYTGTDEVVEIPDGIETIGEGALYSKDKMKKLIMPDSVKTIQNGAFRFCDKTTEIHWSNSLKTIDFAATEALRSMEAIVLPESLETIGEWNFTRCDHLEYIKLPDGLKSIGRYSFSINPRLKAVVIPESVTEIGTDCFDQCHDDFMIIAKPGSEGEKYAKKNHITYSSLGTEVSYISSCDSKAQLTVKLNGATLGSSATIHVGDTLYISGHTSCDDLNISVNGKCINYQYYEDTKNELDDYPVVVTGPTKVIVTSVTASTNLDDCVNAPGSDLHFTGYQAKGYLDRGRNNGAYYTSGEEGYIRTEVDLDKEHFLIFDVKVPSNSELIRVEIDDESHEVGKSGPDYQTYAFEVPAGKHTITWYATDSANNYKRRLLLSNVMLTDDIDLVHAKALSIPFPQIDLDKGESLALEYSVEPGMLSGRKKVTWECDDESIAKIVNGTVTGLKTGNTFITGTIDGVKAYVSVYVSDKDYNSSGEDSVPVYDDTNFITQRTKLPDNLKDMYYWGKKIQHVKNDRYAYFFRHNNLYRVDPISQTPTLELVMSTEASINGSAVRGKIIYVMSDMDLTNMTCRITGYDTVQKAVVYSQTFPYDRNISSTFTVDDSGNVYFVRAHKDFYICDSTGRLINKELHSDETLQSGFGSIVIDQVDPYDYSLLVLYRSTEGRAVDYYDEYSFNGMSDGFGFMYGYNDLTGCKKIRNGEIVDPACYIKRPDYSAGGLWTFLDRGGYAVNSNGNIVKFKKDKKSVIGSDWEVLYKMADCRGNSTTFRRPAVYAGGDIYAVNDNNIVYRFDPETKKMKGTYDLGDDDVFDLYEANGKVYAVLGSDTESDSWYATPLDTVEFDQTKTIIRHDHITLTYTEDEVKEKFQASKAETDFTKTSEVFDQLPSIKSPYAAGKMSDKAIADVLRRLNFARWQSGLNEVAVNSQYMERNQKGAVVLAALKTITHTPAKPSGMDDDFYQEACAGVGADENYSGNCGYGQTMYDSIKGYLDETANIQEANIGHRLSLLDMTTDKTSFGYAGVYNCLSMYYADEGTLHNDETYYAWPSAGYFTSNMLDPNAYWHIITDWYRCETLTVTLTYLGNSYVVEDEDILYDSGYNALYFQLPKTLKTAVTKNRMFKDGAEINVRMEGMTDKKGNSIVVDYPVRFMNIHEHNWGTGEVTKKATCTHDGEMTYTCSVCGSEKKKTIPSDPDAHTWDGGVTVSEPSPEGDGEILYTCTECGETRTEIIPWKDPKDQMGEDGTPVGKGASYEAAEEAILGIKNDKDPKGTKIYPLVLRSPKQTKTSIKLAWSKPHGTVKYVLYGNKCGKTNKVKKLKTLTATSVTMKKAVKKITKGKYYKFIIVALDKNNNVVSTSRVIHIATKGGKIGNYKKVTTKAKKSRVTVKKGKSFKLAGKGVPESKKRKVKVHVGIRYESANTKIATVSSKGIIKGKKKGTTYVYAYSQNGKYAKVKVTVK